MVAAKARGGSGDAVHATGPVRVPAADPGRGSASARAAPDAPGARRRLVSRLRRRLLLHRHGTGRHHQRSRDVLLALRPPDRAYPSASCPCGSSLGHVRRRGVLPRADPSGATTDRPAAAGMRVERNARRVCLPTPPPTRWTGGRVIWRVDNADARDWLPHLEVDQRRTVVITDPPWPVGLSEDQGWDPVATWAAVGPMLPRLCRRLVVQIGCVTDPRSILAAVPDSLPYCRSCWLRYHVPSHRGTLLISADLAFVFGSAAPPPRKPQSARGMWLCAAPGVQETSPSMPAEHRPRPVARPLVHITRRLGHRPLRRIRHNGDGGARIWAGFPRVRSVRGICGGGASEHHRGREVRRCAG